MFKDNPKIYKRCYDVFYGIKAIINKFYPIFFLTIALLFVCIISKINNNIKIKKDNQKILELLSNNVNQLNKDYIDKIDYKELEKLYKSNKNLKQITKTFIGFNLAKNYINNNKIDEAKTIYTQIFKNENDKFLKYLAGLNLINILINEEDFEKNIRNLYNNLNKQDNVLIDFVNEKFAIYLIEHAKKEEGKNILKNIKNQDEQTKNRLDIYNKMYNLNLF